MSCCGDKNCKSNQAGIINKEHISKEIKKKYQILTKFFDKSELK
jgi:hypothetical protein